ncbi:MAG: ATP-binding protein [Methanomassiliicoccales archaeon]
MPLVEAQMLELKRELGDLHGLLKTFCAFANTHGGKLLLGADRPRAADIAWSRNELVGWGSSLNEAPI